MDIDKFLDFLKEIISAIKEGRIGWFAVLSSLAFIGGAFYFRDYPWAALVCAALGFFSFYFYKKDAPATIDLSVLSGFRPAEGKIAVELGRNINLSSLKAWVEGEGARVIFLVGPDAVGKTTLIEALQESLKGSFDFSIQRASSPGVAAFFADELAQSLGADWKGKNFKAIIEGERLRRQVLVIDEVESATTSNPGVEEVIQVMLEAGERPFRRVLLVVVEERAWRSSWEEKYWKNRPSSVARELVYRLDRGEALLAAQSLCQASGLVLSDELLNQLTLDSAISPISESANISPLKLSLIIQFIGNACARGQSFSLGDYVALGRDEGLLRAFLVRNLERTREWRIIVGRIVSAVEESSLELDRGRVLLASEVDTTAQEVLYKLEQLRVLRASPQTQKLRIVREWWPILKTLHHSLESEAGSLKQRLLKKYALWSQSWGLRQEGGFFARFHEGHLLLSFRELMKVRHLSAELAQNEGFLGYWKLSRRFRERQLLLVAVLILVSVPVTMGAVRSFRQKLTIANQSGAGLPRDFLDEISGVKELNLVGSIAEFGRLPEGLTHLDARCEKIVGLKGLPKGLVYLGVHSAGISSLADLPKRVSELDVSATKLVSLDSLDEKQKITSLNIEDLPITDMASVPRSVKKLWLKNPDLMKLDGLPDGLTNLELRGTAVETLTAVPDSVKHLVVKFNMLKVKATGKQAIDHLPANLVTLEADLSLADGIVVPDTLANMVLEGVELKALPSSVRYLELKGSASVAGDLSRIRTLKIHDPESASAITWDEISPELTKLKVQLKDLTVLARFSKLGELDLSFSDDLSSLQSLETLPDLRVLDIGHTKVVSFSDVPDWVITISFTDCMAKDLDDFPSGLKVLDLSRCVELHSLENLPHSLTTLLVPETGISSLESLRELPNLKKLDISKCRNLRGKLPRLPESLDELTIGLNQFDYIEGLPGSVRKLRFVD